MSKFIKRTLPLVGVGAFAYITLNKIADNYFQKAFKRNDALSDRDLDAHLPTDALKEIFNQEIETHINWFKSSQKRHLKIRSYDGIHLDGMLVKNHENHRYIILVHGFNADRYTLLKQAYEFDKRDLNILMIDQRAYGDSEGEYTTFGLKEQFDVLQWIDALLKIDEAASIVLYGVSMGAASVMMALASDIDKRVKCVIEEGGYTAIEPIFKAKMEKEAQFSSLILRLCDTKVFKELGFTFNDITPIDALKENEVPICFVHSLSDSLVPYEMANELYHANKGIKAFYPIQGMPHAYACYKEKYFDDLMDFINKYM